VIGQFWRDDLRSRDYHVQITPVVEGCTKLLKVAFPARRQVIPASPR
jgi:hypothetical protein